MKYYKYAKKLDKVYKKLSKCIVDEKTFINDKTKELVSIGWLAKKIGYTVKHTKRLVTKFLSSTYEEFVTHKNVENQHQKHYDNDFKSNVFKEFGYYCEKLIGENDQMENAPWTDFTDYQIELNNKLPSYSTLWRWLSEMTVSPFAWKKTKRLFTMRLQGQLPEATEIEKLIAKNAKASLERTVKNKPKVTKKFGERLEADGCTHLWSKTHKYKLTIVGICDFSGWFLSAWCEQTETNRAYIRTFKDVFTKEGFPTEIRSDRRTGFTTNGLYNTPLSTCLTDHDIIINCESYPQHKPKIERIWWTLQMRLPAYLKVHGIVTEEQFIEFVNSGNLVKWYNEKFNKHVDRTSSAFRKVSQLTIDSMFIKSHLTKVLGGNLIKHNNGYWYPVTDEGRRMILNEEKGSSVKLEVNLENNQAFLKYRNHRYTLIEANPLLDSLSIDQIASALENETEMHIYELERETRTLSFQLNQLKSIILDSNNDELISKSHLITT